MNYTDRRKFLKTSSLALAASAISSFKFPLNLKDYTVSHLGLQLWSVRDAMAQDAKNTIASLRQMGYREVEGFGYADGKIFGMPLRDYAMLLRDNDISTPSIHHPLTTNDWDSSSKDLKDSTKRALDDLAGIGLKYIVMPWMDEDHRKRIPEMVNIFNAAGKYCKSAGVKFGYHNHDFEYTMRGPDGRLLIEWILHETDPSLVTMEMDMYWVSFAKYNPVDMFRIYPGRWELCHVKDMANTEKRETIEVGDGVIDFSTIFKSSSQAGLKYYIIELENYRTNSMDGVNKARKGFLAIK